MKRLFSVFTLVLFQLICLGQNLTALQLVPESTSLPFYVKKASHTKKVLFILPWYVGGGMGTAFISLINNFPDPNTAIDICVLAKKGPNMNFPTLRDDVTYVELDEVKKKEYDAVVCYAQWTPTSVWVNRLHAKRQVQWIHCDVTSQKWIESFEKKLSRMENVKGYVLVSDVAKQNFVKAFPSLAKKSYAVYNIIDNDYIRKASLVPQTEMIQNDGLLNVVSVSRIVPVKNLDMAVRVHAQLESEGIHFRWYVVGYGPERENLEALVKELGLEGKFIFLGYKENPYPYIKAADIFSLFSKAEGFGLVVTEAKILGRPIIVTNFKAAYEQIESNVNGLIVENNLESICKGMRKLLLNPSLRNKFSRALEGFSFDNTEGYREVLIALFGKQGK